MNQTLHQELVQLRGRARAWLAGGSPEQFSPLYGICNSVKLERPDRALMNALIDQWPGHSGADSYPVPHPALSPQAAFDESDEHEMWDPEFEYARNRWALLEWLIEQTASEADQ